MFRRKTISWRRLSRSFSGTVLNPDSEILAAGHLILPPSCKWFVRIHPGLDGIVIRRVLVPFLSVPIELKWNDIATVTEYDSDIRRFETAATQTNAYVTFKNPSIPNMMMPWCMEFNDLLPDAIGYRDCKHMFWRNAVDEIE